jgi:hypothetical protein
MEKVVEAVHAAKGLEGVCRRALITWRGRAGGQWLGYSSDDYPKADVRRALFFSSCAIIGGAASALSIDLPGPDFGHGLARAATALRLGLSQVELPILSHVQANHAPYVR